ncbi:MAG: hypothetical protein CL931_05790 [Deltaproteobacteria bacterium]|nr:hypothetical protein [Deltaproteobacteria bacterium]
MAAYEDDVALAPGRSLTRAVTPRKREAEDWTLVLVAEGFEPRARQTAQGWRIEVDTDRVGAADGILTAWCAERAERLMPPPPEPDATTRPSQMALAYALALVMVAFHLLLVRTGNHRAYVDAGDSQAALVLEGEVHRTLTALTLHADLSHVAGNALFGGFFLAALAGRLGVGCALLAFLASGTAGNLANAVWYGHAHSSVGASTGVFGLVGVLAGLAAWRRHEGGPSRRGAWVPLGAGLAIVAMLGGPGPKVDFAAHLFGLAAGALAGLAISLPLARRPRPEPPAQIAAFLTSVVLVLGAWRLA